MILRFTYRKPRLLSIACWIFSSSGLASSSRTAEADRLRPRIGNSERVYHDRIDLHAHGERLAVAVEDGSARSLNFYVADLLGVGELAVFVVIEDLKVDRGGGQ